VRSSAANKSFNQWITLLFFAGGDWPLLYADTQSFTQATNLYFFSFTLIITLVVLAFYLGSVLENFQQSVRAKHCLSLLGTSLQPRVVPFMHCEGATLSKIHVFLCAG
jgi:hypothetical protein